jgi:peptide/nickel transport system substrate-binding protein
MSKKLSLILGLLVIVGLAVSGCAGETVEVIKTVEVLVTEEAVGPAAPTITRVGGWLDTIVMVEEPDSNAAVTRLEVGDIDVFAYNVSEPDVAARIYASDTLAYETAYGNYNDLTFMPSAEKTFGDTGVLNPFWSDKVREAMNWLVDRDYIAEEITGGLAVPRFVAINYASKDSALLADKIAEIELKYAHNPDKAIEVIDAEMEAMGAVKDADGKWTYEGEPVVLIGLIRTEDERLEIGDYVSNLLEDIGFTVQRDYKTSAEASPCWMRGDPESGCAHFYTGGWVSTAISRDAAQNFGDFYTPRGLPTPPWQAYSPTPEFDDVCGKLYVSDFATVEERTDLMRQAIDMSLEDSQRIWLKDDKGIAPHPANITLASDLSGSIYGSRLWAQTLRFTDRIGGSMTIAMPSIMTEPWNPIGGSNWVYDMMPIRGMQSGAVVPDPFTGLFIPFHLESAEVYIKTGLPVSQNLDWATLEFVDEITVPEDAWADWDAVNQVFITAGERFPDGATTNSKMVMYYQDDLFDVVKWHDGSDYTIADFVMFMIMQFDPSKEDSPIYDEATLASFNSFMDGFKGWKITSEDPLIIEYYTDAYSLDAENNVTNFRAASPNAYYNGEEVSWHALAVAWKVEENGEATFTADKADALDVDRMSFISGPSLALLKAQLDTAQADGFIPYEPTLGQYVTADEVTTRYANLQEWYRRYGHFWVNTGPYFLQKAFPVEGTLIMQHNPFYPDLATRWNAFSSAPVPEVEVDGSGTVTIGSEATYDVYVEFQGEPYAMDEIMLAKYLVFDATGELAYVGEATAVEDGYWTVTLSADVTGALTAGSNQLAVIVVSERALVPVKEVFQFVTQ